MSGSQSRSRVEIKKGVRVMTKRLGSLIYRLGSEMNSWYMVSDVTEDELVRVAWAGRIDKEEFENIRLEWEDFPRVTRLCEEIIKCLCK